MSLRIGESDCETGSLSTSSLVEQNDSVELWVEKASVCITDSASGPAMEEDDRLSVRVTALFVAREGITGQPSGEAIIYPQIHPLTTTCERPTPSARRSSRARSRGTLWTL